MRKFIISDLHGNGNIYKTVMSYLDNISSKEDITLYINGDLIDRGLDSVNMLLDVKRRITKGPFKIVYLGGNHELMMYQIFQKRIRGLNTYDDIWFHNGGLTTDLELHDRLTKEQIFELLEECPRELLNEKEAFWIDTYSSNIYGLNTMKGITK